MDVESTIVSLQNVEAIKIGLIEECKSKKNIGLKDVEATRICS